MYLILTVFFAINTFASVNIVGGQDVLENSLIMKSTVGLITERKGKLTVFCTGTVIHSSVVLSAAHCVDELVHPVLYVANGKDPIKNSNKYKIKALKYFKPFFGYEAMDKVEDIAILITDRPMVDYSSVPIGDPAYLSSNIYIQSGYGFRSWEPTSYEYPELGILQSLSTGTFSSLEKHIITINTDSSSGVMGGDSGGPLFVENGGQLILNGVLSQGGPSGEGQHAVYAHPYFFSEWLKCSFADFSISDNLKDQFPCDTKSLINMTDLPEYNRKQCQQFKEGWDLVPVNGSCWPWTEKSCNELAAETSGDVYWDADKKSCEVR